MKMSAELQAAFRDALADVDPPPRVGGVERFRWDCLWAVPGDRRAELLRDADREGLSDAHIYTALKSIVPDQEEA